MAIRSAAEILKKYGIQAPKLNQSTSTDLDTERDNYAGLGGRALSGIAGVGNLLDLPGSSVRDVVGLIGSGGDFQKYNPFDQWMTPFSDTNRVTGRELLRGGGLVGEEDNWGNFSAGIGAEILMDPFFAPAKWLGLGAKGTAAAAKTGATGAAKAGLFDGPSLGMLGLQTAYEAIPDAAKQAVGNSVVGKAADRIGVEYSRMFDAAAKGRRGKEGQGVARGLTKKERLSGEAVREEILPLSAELQKMGWNTPEKQQRVRDIIEGVVNPNADDPVELIQRVKQTVEDSRAQMKALGRYQDDLDDVVDYGARQLGAHVKELYDSPRGTGKGAIPFDTTNPADVARQEWLKGYSRGTNMVNEVVTDPQFGEIVNFYGETKQAIDEVRKLLAGKYGDEITPQFHAKNDNGSFLFQDENGKIIAKTAKRMKEAGKDLGDGTWEFTNKTSFGRGDVSILTPVMKDRYEEISKKIVYNPEIREAGVFTNSPIFDAHERAMGMRLTADRIDATYDFMTLPGALLEPQQMREIGKKNVTVGDMLKAMKVDAREGTEILAERMGRLDELVTKKDRVNFRKQVIREDLVQDMLEPWNKAELPKEIDNVSKLAQSMTSLFKAGVLTWPARYVRDVTSGQIRNWERGWFDFGSFRQANGLLQGGTVEGLDKIKAVREWLDRTGREINAESASDAAREMYATYKGTPFFQNTDMAMEVPGVSGFDDLVGLIPGMKNQTFNPFSLSSWGDLANTAMGRREGTNLNPFNIAGVQDMSGNVRTATEFGPAVAGDVVGRYTDDTNRLTPFLNQLKKDIDPSEAMREINFAQVDYSPANFTKTEQFLKKFIPFYSFTAKQTGYVATELARNPGGRLGQMVRATRHGHESGGITTPDYVSQTTSIPLGMLPDGSASYLTGLGLMHEAPLSFLNWQDDNLLPDAGDAIAETISRTAPWLKAPIELAAGESFFQRGPMGGRDLMDMDPTMGRLASNIGQWAQRATGTPMDETVPWETNSGQAHAIGGRTFEHVMANSPFSRGISTARQLTDPRKWEGGPFPGSRALLQTMTGVRFTDVSPAAQDAVLRERVQAYARENIGAKMYQTVYVPKEVIAENEKKNPQLAEEQKSINRLRVWMKKRQESRQGTED